MPRGGDRRHRRLPPLSGSHRRVSAPPPPRLGTLPRRAVPHPKDSPWCEESSNAATRLGVHQTYEPDLLRARLTLLRRADNLTQAHQAYLDRLFTAHPRPKVAWDALQDLYQIYQADDLEAAHQALARFADLYDQGDIPEYHDVVDNIIAWGQEILAYHPSRRASNGPLEGSNNLLQVLRRVAHGFTNYQTTQPAGSS